MATTTDLPSGLLRRSDPVAYLVRSFQTNARIRSLTTGTFNRVVKDRIAFRLSGAPSVLGELARVRIRLSSKPYKHTLLRKPCQRERPTEFPPDFHNGTLGLQAHGERNGSRRDGRLVRSVRAKLEPENPTRHSVPY